MGGMRRTIECISITEDDKHAYCGTRTGDVLKFTIDRDDIRVSAVAIALVFLVAVVVIYASSGTSCYFNMHQRLCRFLHGTVHNRTRGNMKEVCVRARVYECMRMGKVDLIPQQDCGAHVRRSRHPHAPSSVVKSCSTKTFRLQQDS